jgi:hypothetical protein
MILQLPVTFCSYALWPPSVTQGSNKKRQKQLIKFSADLKFLPRPEEPSETK